MRTRKFKAQPTNAFFATVNQMFGRLLPVSGFRDCWARGNQIVKHISNNQTVLGSSRKLGGASEHLIDSSEKRICRLSFQFKSPHVIERRSNSHFLRRTWFIHVFSCTHSFIKWTSKLLLFYKVFMWDTCGLLQYPFSNLFVYIEYWNELLSLNSRGTNNDISSSWWETKIANS